MFVEERTPSCFMCTFFKEFPQFLFYFCIQGNLSGKESFHKNQSMPPTWPPLFFFSFKCRITLVFKCQFSVTITLVFKIYYEYFLSYRPLKYIFYFTLLISVCYKSSGDEKCKSVLGCQHDRICRVTEISLVFLVIQWRIFFKQM